MDKPLFPKGKTPQPDIKCNFCNQMLGKRIVDKLDAASPKCSKCGSKWDLEAVDKAGDILIKEEHEE